MDDLAGFLHKNMKRRTPHNQMEMDSKCQGSLSVRGATFHVFVEEAMLIFQAAASWPKLGSRKRP